MALVSTDEFQKHLEEDLDDAGKRVAWGVLERLSTYALAFGNPNWTDAQLPPVVKMIIIQAALRYWYNPENHEIDRAGDEQIGNFDYGAELAMGGFTPAERAAIEGAAGKTQAKAFGSIDLTGRGTFLGRRDIYVPVIGANTYSDFPFFETELGDAPDGHRVDAL